MLEKLIISLFVAIVIVVIETSACDGCVSLHEESFTRLTPRFKYSYVKFDKMHAARDVYGIFDRLSLEQQKVEDLLFGGVYVRYDEHDRTNQEFAQKYGVFEEDYPVYKIFRDGYVEVATFPKDIPLTLFNLREFLWNHTDLVLEPSGQLEKLELIGNKFVMSNEKEKLVKEAEALVETLDKENEKWGQLFVDLMKEIIYKGYDFIPEETDAILMTLIQGSDDHKELQARLTVFGSFTIPKDKIKYNPRFY